ncbi:hypothetical protein [Stenomitos frigidus]|uniref:VOC domain-containing protein n=1 Tax=Stenomitos frigidus ULC18 TaxID=2107698 RepID=A0A2T1E3T2_9CYAN|nr:hypothetical protein [Stenomitos frigidus]PSB27361.1 hypothetical protein C7B82_16605 [Stenomitos frigidus ULC18]
MLHHFSIAAENPSRVAHALAEVLHGECAPFPPCPGSFMAIALDNYGTMIEVYPAETELMPGFGTEQVTFSSNAFASPFSATHVAISVPTSQQKIEQIAAREGWRAVRCNRDSYFDVIEFWVENKLMIELLTPPMAAKYLEFMQPQNLAKFLSAPEEPVSV